MPLVWQSQLVRKQIERRAKTTAGIWKVSQADLRSILLPVPPVEEQYFIVQEAERIFSVVDSLEATIQAELKRSEQLRQAILKKAFSGQLVPQNPDDEPASVLLERIKAEKEAGTSGRGRGSKREKQEKLFS